MTGPARDQPVRIPGDRAAAEVSAERTSGPLGGALWAVVLLAYLLRILVALDWDASHPLTDRPVIDEASYERWAVEIAEGDWLGDEVFFQEPLYPYWLGAVYSVFGAQNRTAVRHAQAFLGALTVLLVALATRRLFGRGAALAAALLVALHRPGLLFVALLLKPNLFLPVLSGLVLCLLALRGSRDRAYRRWLLAGVLVGLGALLRGNMLLLVPLFALLPLVRGGVQAGAGGSGRGRTDRLRGSLGAWRGSAALVGGVLLVLVPVAARNYAVGDVFALTTSGAGTNVYGGNNPQNPYGRATEFDWVRGIPEYEASDWKHEAERRVGHVLAPDEVSSFWLGATLDSLRDRPGAHARILWNKLRLTLGSYEVPDNHHLDWDAQFVAVLSAPWPGWGVLGALGIAGLLLWCGSSLARARGLDGGGAWELAVLVVAYLGTIVATVTSMRVRLALVPLIAPFAGFAAVQLAALVPTLRARWGLAAPGRPVGLAVALSLAIAIVWTPLLSASEREADWFKRDFNYAVYLAAEGRADEARALAVELDARYPGTSRLQTMLAGLDFEAALAEFASEPRSEAGRQLVEGAMARLRPVAEGRGVNPRERFRAHKLAGRIQRYLGQAAAAGRFFTKAIEFDPDDREALDGWAWSRAVLARGLDAPEAKKSGSGSEPASPADRAAARAQLDAWIAAASVAPAAATARASAYAHGATALLLLEASQGLGPASAARLIAAAGAEYRLALAADPEEPLWKLGLANALYLAADAAPAEGDARRAAVAEAEALLLGLEAAGADVAPQLAALRQLR